MLKKKEEIAKIDKEIAKRIYQSRLIVGLSRDEVGLYIGVSGQQIAKYEAGRNRISASRLALVAEKLGKKINYFFSGLRKSNINIEEKENFRN